MGPFGVLISHIWGPSDFADLSGATFNAECQAGSHWAPLLPSSVGLSWGSNPQPSETFISSKISHVLSKDSLSLT